MKSIIGLFFRAVHSIIGPVLLLVDRATRPQGVTRDPETQRQVDEQTRRLVLYQFRMCPFCIKVRRAVRRLSLDIETRDVLRDPASREQLLAGGGEVKVPCLRIETEDGRVEWMYESSDIIQYLGQRFA